MASRDHEIENALHIDVLEPALIKALQQSWCQATCWNGCKEAYWQQNPALDPARDSDKTGTHNPSFGNCLVTTLVAWAERDFADEIIPSLVRNPGDTKQKAAWHFFLEAKTADGEIQIDPTRQQFKPGYIIEDIRPAHPRHHELIYYSVFEAAEAASLKERLGLLISRLQDNGYACRHNAAAITARLEDRFSYARQKPAPLSSCENKGPAQP